MTDETAAETTTGWVPRQSGWVYCSPCCGAKCTKQAYNRAVQEAGELAVRMGDGWVPRVWENMGWYYQVIRGAAKISPHIRGSAIHGNYTIHDYCCIINSVYSTYASAETPEQALAEALAESRAKAEQFNSDLDVIQPIDVSGCFIPNTARTAWARRQKVNTYMGEHPGVTREQAQQAILDDEADRAS